MKTEIITIPFDIKLAKKIQAEKHPGMIVTREEKDVEVLCFDAKRSLPVISLVTENDKEQSLISCMSNGSYHSDGDVSEYDLFLQVPEWTQYKEGDVLACEDHIGPNDYCKWFAILKGEVHFALDRIDFSGYVSYDYDSTYEVGRLAYDESFYNIRSIRLATDEEKEIFIKRLKEEDNERAKGILKSFFNIEVKLECKFKPFQQVLVRNHRSQTWTCDLFSNIEHYPNSVCVGGVWAECIPYNDQTKHLLGTTDSWEEK